MTKKNQETVDGKKYTPVIILGTFFIIINIYLIVNNTLFSTLNIALLAESIFIFFVSFYFYYTISSSKKITEELELAKIKMETEKARDEALLNSIGDGVVATDKDGIIIFINNVAGEMLGWDNNIIGEKLEEISMLADSEGNHVATENHPLHQSIITKKKIITKDYHFINKDKINIAVYISATPVILKDKIVGAIEVFRDITKEKEIDKAKSEFVSLASHQLRTPLSTVNWYAEMLLAGDAGTINEEQKKYLQEIYDSNNRMIDLVNCLLNLSRIELGTFVLKPQDVLVTDVVESLLEELAVQVSQKQIKIKKDFQKKIPTIKSDPNLLRIIFQNLLTNAIKYTPEKGSVKVIIQQRPGDMLIEVTDTGYGIPKDQQDKIFTKLYRATNVKDKITDGNGLGLYTAKSIVEQSGGKIWFESEENKGTSFFVVLPLEAPKKDGVKMLSAL
ncbi:MAG: hypothetical protein ACD_72C00110G0001 [uncultured bacterium]|nr:MAG: hypothetical protein ACD_72C00110G0001 [uncultured bacterium]